MSCGAGTQNTQSTSPSIALLTGQWEITIHSVADLPFYAEVNFSSVVPQTGTGGTTTVNPEVNFVLPNAKPGDSDACKVGILASTFNFNSPATGEFDYTFSANGVQLNASANGAGTFSATTMEGTYLSSASGPVNLCSIVANSGMLAGLPAPTFSGPWAGSVGGDAKLNFESVAGQIQVTGLFGNTAIAVTCEQIGATLEFNVPNFSSVNLREVPNTSDGYAPGHSGPAIYVWLQTLGTGGVLIPAQ
jgi:hypothetical protein